jgi:AraC-like DNA-binding protein
MFMKWSLKKIMMRLHRAFVASAEQTQLLSFDPLVQMSLERVEDHIVQCIPFHVSDLAAEFGMSADYFSKSFKHATGWSPMDYFQRRRVQRACSLLLTTGQTATEIAHTLGYCDAAHFSHLFKRHYGLSPRQYRRTYAAGTG